MEQQPLQQHKTKLKELTLELPKDYQIVSCPSCNLAVPATDLNIHDKIGKCCECNALFPLQDTINLLLQATTVDQPKQTILRPEGIEVFEFKNELELSFKKHFSFWLIPALIFFPFFSILFTTIYFNVGTMPILVPVLFWIPTLISLYLTIVRSTIRINIDDKLSVSYTHLTLPTNREV